ncbi:MAG: indolepyruvate ferredoxin oxidoreductase subunit alpha [Thermoguttaceae bacterium]
MKKLFSGNEAIARGAYEAGVVVAAGYPGTPSTEILENVAAQYKDAIYCEWAPNEKVAFEVAAGASLTGVRAMTTMKHVGLNVAADPLLTLAYTGIVGGFVAVVADDPGMHSSQNEQDTRHYARMAAIPLLDPSDSQEACDFVKTAFEISEEYRTPVIVRTSTRVSHSRSLVTEHPRETPPRASFQKDPPRFVAIPMWARQMRARVEDRTHKLQAAAAKSPLNKIEWRGRDVGVITCGIAYQYVREAFPNASILKLGWVLPFPDEIIRDFARQVETLVVVEEGDTIIQEHIASLGFAAIGKPLVPAMGELSADVLAAPERNLPGARPLAPPNAVPHHHEPAVSIPSRPPVLCPGCPHRGIFYALGRLDVIVTGDIGCYSLGVLPPLSRIDTILCMGGGISMAHGVDKAGNDRPVVGILGDSTFFHSGITGLIDIAYNRGAATIIVVDNRVTAMTGHQDNPGSGTTLMGEPTVALSIEEIGRACGIKNVVVVDPRDIVATSATIKNAVESPEAWLIVSKSPCPLHLREPVGPVQEIDGDKCKKCKLCLKLGCPGIENVDGEIRTNVHLCAGCEMCTNLCPASAIDARK